jgi:hypothetical protein
MIHVIQKKTDLKRDFAAGGYLSEAQNHILDPPPPLHTVPVYVYTVYLFTQGRWRERGELMQSERDKDQDTELTIKRPKIT